MNQRVREFFRLSRLEAVLSAAVALTLALVIVGVVVYAAGADPLATYGALLKGSFGSAYYISLTIRYAIPMLLIAMSFTICERCGYFNIGQEAQMSAAGICAVLVKYCLPDLPWGLSLVLMVLTGLAAAVLLSVGPALLKYYFHVPEAIILVMLCYIMELLANYLFMYTKMAYPNSATTPRSIGLDIQIPSGVMYVLVAVLFLAYAFFMKKSVWGYRISLVGKNPVFTNAQGISSLKTLMVSASIGGALAGFAGLFEVLSVYGFMYYNFCNGMGFLGISAALLGRQSPVGMLIGAVLFGALNSGSVTLAATTGVSGAIVQVIQSFITLFATVSAIAVIKRIFTGKHRKGGGK